MNKRTLPLAAFLIGVALIVASFLWVGVRQGSSTVWTEEDEAQYSAATVEWRAIGHSHGPQEEVAAQEEARITDEYQQQVDKFASAANRGRTVALIL